MTELINMRTKIIANYSCGHWVLNLENDVSPLHYCHIIHSRCLEYDQWLMYFKILCSVTDYCRPHVYSHRLMLPHLSIHIESLMYSHRLLPNHSCLHIWLPSVWVYSHREDRWQSPYPDMAMVNCESIIHGNCLGLTAKDHIYKLCSIID